MPYSSPTQELPTSMPKGDARFETDNVARRFAVVFRKYARGTANGPPMALVSSIPQPAFYETSVVLVVLEGGHAFLPVGVADVSYGPFPRMVCL